MCIPLANDMQRYFRISLIPRSTRDTPKTAHSPSVNEKSPTWRSPTKCGSVSLVMRHACPRHGNWSGEHPFFPWLGHRVLGRTSNPPERQFGTALLVRPEISDTFPAKYAVSAL